MTKESGVLNYLYLFLQFGNIALLGYMVKTTVFKERTWVNALLAFGVFSMLMITQWLKNLVHDQFSIDKVTAYLVAFPFGLLLSIAMVRLIARLARFFMRHTFSRRTTDPGAGKHSG